MIEQYLSNKNENATISKSKSFSKLNKALRASLDASALKKTKIRLPNVYQCNRLLPPPPPLFFPILIASPPPPPLFVSLSFQLNLAVI